MPKPHGLSKSRIMSGLQCEKRLWLETHKPELGYASEKAEHFFAIGNEVGEMAQRLVPDGVLIDYSENLTSAIEQTRQLLKTRPDTPIFEATFLHDGVLVRVDLLFPEDGGYRLVEVKAAASYKEQYTPDCAIQAWVMKQSGYPVNTAELAHLNREFIYKGDGVYDGLFHHENVTELIAPMVAQVPGWISKFRTILAGPEPEMEPGDHCNYPYACQFQGICWAEETAEYPITSLPYGGAVVAELLEEGYQDIRDIPEGRLTNPRHEWVRRVTISGKADVGRDLVDFLRSLAYPRYYFDFETVQHAVPKWPGTRPYQSHLPFQWSCHIEEGPDQVRHDGYLDFDANIPLRPLAEKMIANLGDQGPVLVWGHFENTVMNRLAEFLPDLAQPLAAIQARIVDLLPWFRENYYHPNMHGSWSIKAVLPTIVPDLSYDDFEEVADGTAAQVAYAEAMHPETDEARRQQLFDALWEYCKMDTWAMVRMVRNLT